MAGNVKSKKSALDDILECSLCLHQITEPHTLQQCLHSFCKTCIEAVPKNIDKGQPGWNCPLCRNFSNEHSIKQSFFINDLLSIHNTDDASGNDEKVICKQCPKQLEASWKCVDCRIELCSDCQVIHLMIPMLKGHRVVPLDAETEKVIDRLIFCSIHVDEPIKFNCQVCEVPLCINCKIIDHDGHKTETVKMALERLQPKIEEYNKKIEQNNDVLKNQIKAIANKIEETKSTFASCKTDLQNHGEKIFQQLKAILNKKESEISKQEIQAVQTLDDKKQQLENKLSENTNLISLVAASTAKARHTSLLHEFQSGLLQKVKENGEDNYGNVEVESVKAKVTNRENIQEQFIKLENMIGEVKLLSEKFKINENGEVTLHRNQYNKLSENIVDLITRPFQRVKVIALPGWSNRVNYIDGKLWICCYQQKSIMIYSTTGELLQTIKDHGHSFHVIKKSPHNNNLLAGGEDGLYVSDDEVKVWKKLADGNFVDMCVHDERISALEINTQSVITFTWDSQNLKWNKTHTFCVNTSYTCDAMTFYDNHIFICLFSDKTLLKYTTDGKKVLQYTTNFPYPMLCGIDSAGHILLTSYTDYKLHILHENNNTLIEKDINVALEVPQCPRDVVLDVDNNVWLLHGDSSIHLIKYILKER